MSEVCPKIMRIPLEICLSDDEFHAVLKISMTSAARFAVSRASVRLFPGGRENGAAVVFVGFFSAGGAFNFVVVFFHIFFEDFSAFRAFIFKKRHKNSSP